MCCAWTLSSVRRCEEKLLPACVHSHLIRCTASPRLPFRCCCEPHAQPSIHPAASGCRVCKPPLPGLPRQERHRVTRSPPAIRTPYSRPGWWNRVALLLDQRTPRRQRTAAQQVDRARNLRPKPDTPLAGPRIRPEHRRQQCSTVWLLRPAEDGIGRTQFENLPQIHDGYAVTNP